MTPSPLTQQPRRQQWQQPQQLGIPLIYDHIPVTWKTRDHEDIFGDLIQYPALDQPRLYFLFKLRIVLSKDESRIDYPSRIYVDTSSQNTWMRGISLSAPVVIGGIEFKEGTALCDIWKKSGGKGRQAHLAKSLLSHDLYREFCSKYCEIDSVDSDLEMAAETLLKLCTDQCCCSMFDHDHGGTAPTCEESSTTSVTVPPPSYTIPPMQAREEVMITPQRVVRNSLNSLNNIQNQNITTSLPPVVVLPPSPKSTTYDASNPRWLMDWRCRASSCTLVLHPGWKIPHNIFDDTTDTFEYLLPKVLMGQELRFYYIQSDPTGWLQLRAGVGDVNAHPCELHVPRRSVLMLRQTRQHQVTTASVTLLVGSVIENFTLVLPIQF